MNKAKDNTLNTIISITKEEINNNNKSTTIDISKNKNNENQYNLKNYNNNGEDLLNNNEENDDEEDRKYFEFNAHFKYQELVDALNSLQSKKNESTSNTSNANINNKNPIKSNTKNNHNNITNNTNPNNTNNTNCVLNKNKPYNYKVISRNIQMNNYIEYLEYIEENKNNNDILTSIANNLKHNKTSFLPQTELLKKKIDFHLQKLNELKNKKKDVASLSKNKKKYK